MSDEKKYVCGEPLTRYSRVSLGEKVIHKRSGEVYEVADMMWNASRPTPGDADRVLLFVNYRGYYSIEQYCRAVPVKEQFEWVFENVVQTPFRDLSAEEMKLIVDAFASYEQIVEELTPREGWKPVEECTTHISGVYRVKRKVVATPLDIPWNLIDVRWKWAAMDNTRDVYLYECEPHTRATHGVWSTSYESRFKLISDCLQLNTEGIDWNRSLTKRPKGV